MEIVDLNNIIVTNLKKMPTEGGDVLHYLKSSDIGFKKFGEVYFSWIKNNSIKAWKMHKKMTLNLAVPIGKVRFVFYTNSNSELYREEIIGEDTYSRLTVPPCIWFGFQGLSQKPSLLANVANIEHDPDEVNKVDKSYFSFDWS